MKYMMIIKAASVRKDYRANKVLWLLMGNI